MLRDALKMLCKLLHSPITPRGRYSVCIGGGGKSSTLTPDQAITLNLVLRGQDFMDLEPKSICWVDLGSCSNPPSGVSSSRHFDLGSCPSAILSSMPSPVGVSLVPNFIPHPKMHPSNWHDCLGGTHPYLPWICPCLLQCCFLPMYLISSAPSISSLPIPSPSILQLCPLLKIGAFGIKFYCEFNCTFSR